MGIYEIPLGVKQQLNRLKKQGHKLFICSGRPKAMLDEKWLDGTFDGYILNNGGYVELMENLFMKIEWIMSYV